jgi:hypothetical protein
MRLKASSKYLPGGKYLRRAALSDALVACLLKGPRTQPPDPVSDAELVDAFWTALIGGSALWAQHEVELRARAQSWDWKPSIGGGRDEPPPMFWGEYFSHGDACARTAE